MVSYQLSTWLSGHIFAFFFIFARVGSIMMLFPGIGESFVTPRARLLLAFGITFLLLTPMLPRVPAMPADIGGMVSMLAYEIMIGLFFGTVIRLVMSVLEDAGAIISLQMGLSNATILNPALAIQSPLASAFLSVMGITLIFITGLDHMLIRSMVSIYDTFPPGGALIPGDMAQMIIQTANKSFVLGIQLSMPFLVIGLLMYISVGMMQKLMPQVQLFLVVLPIQIWGGLALMALTLAGIITVWLRYFDQVVGTFFVR